MTEHRAFCPAPMLLRFDSYEGGIAKGSLKTLYDQAAFPFYSMDQLLMIMDGILDAENFPENVGRFRHLKTGDEKEEETKIPGQTDSFWKPVSADRYSEGDKKAETGGFRGQMTVTVRRREYGSMQGTVNVKGEKTHFRSALELMHMFHEYLEHTFHAYA